MSGVGQEAQERQADHQARNKTYSYLQPGMGQAEESREHSTSQGGGQSEKAITQERDDWRC